MRNSAPSIPPFCFPSHEGPSEHTTRTKFNNFRIRVPPRHDRPQLESELFGSAGRVLESRVVGGSRRRLAATSGEVYTGSCPKNDKWMSITLPSLCLLKIYSTTYRRGCRRSGGKVGNTRSNPLHCRFNIMNTNQYWFSCMFCWLPVVKKNCCWRRTDFEWIKCLFSERRTRVLSRTWQLRFRCQLSRPFTFNFSFTLDRECIALRAPLIEVKMVN